MYIKSEILTSAMANACLFGAVAYRIAQKGTREQRVIAACTVGLGAALISMIAGAIMRCTQGGIFDEANPKNESKLRSCLRMGAIFAAPAAGIGAVGVAVLSGVGLAGRWPRG